MTPEQLDKAIKSIERGIKCIACEIDALRDIVNSYTTTTTSTTTTTTIP